MSDKFIINGGKALSGAISTQGSKNSGLAVLAASVIANQPCHITNLPNIADVHDMIAILESIGVHIEKKSKNEITIHAQTVDTNKIDFARIGKIRASIMLMGALATRTDTFKMMFPGGDQIGSRPVDAHLEALREIGYLVTESADTITVSAPTTIPDSVTLMELSVTATINVLLALVRSEKPVTIYCAAQDYSVLEVCWFLETLGVTIEGIGTHTLTITGTKRLTDSHYEIMPDPIEVGTWVALAAATRSSLTVKSASPDMLRLELLYFKQMGISFSLENKRMHSSEHYTVCDIVVKQHSGLKPIRHLHNMPAPGFIPDLLPPFAVLLTQANGTSLIHDWMYEGRLRYIGELVKMGASANILDPHRAVIIGPSKLFGKEIVSFDIRAGATLIIAALVAEGESCITDVYHIDRGYEQIDTRLQAIGADIKRI